MSNLISLFIVQIGLDHAAHMDSPIRNGTEKYRIKTLCIGSDQLADVYYIMSIRSHNCTMCRV